MAQISKLTSTVFPLIDRRQSLSPPEFDGSPMRKYRIYRSMSYTPAAYAMGRGFMISRLSPVFLALPLVGLLSACQADPEWANSAALKIGAPRVDAPVIRERQTTTFFSTQEDTLMAEVTQVLQDLGFTIEESAPRFGVLAGSKDRDAVEAPQVAAQVALTIGLLFLGVQHNPVWDTDQVIRATISTRPTGPRDTMLRVSFERIVTNNHGISRMEELTDPEFSYGFFDKVRQGLGRAQ